MNKISRFKQVRKALGFSQARFAELLRWPTYKVSHIEGGKQALTAEAEAHFLSFAKHYFKLEIDPQWWETGQGKEITEADSKAFWNQVRHANEDMMSNSNKEPDNLIGTASKVSDLQQEEPELVKTTFYEDVRASAGQGHSGVEFSEVQNIQFSRSLFDLAGILSPKNELMVIRVEGQSMEPHLISGDLILMERWNGRVDEGATYVIRYGDDILVKQLQPIRSEETLRLISVNPAYKTQDIKGSELEQVQIIGKVTGKIGRV